MDRLTLDDAIKYIKEVVYKNRKNKEKNTIVIPNSFISSADCAEKYEQVVKWLEELESYRDIGTLKELKELKENGAFTGLELTKLAIMQKELKEYKDLEEQGLLVRLPCKVGDDLYCIVNGEVKKLKVHSFGVPDFEITDIEFKYVDGFKIVRFVGEVGKTVFLTREEAEKKLEEMKNESKRCDKGNKTR